MPHVSLLFPASRGIDCSIDMLRPDGQTAGAVVEWAKNLRIAHNRWRTRNSWKAHAVTGADEDLEKWHASPTQDAIPYIRTAGAGLHYQVSGRDRLIEIAGGEMWSLTPAYTGVAGCGQDVYRVPAMYTPRIQSVTTFTLSKLPRLTVLGQSPALRAIQAENYVILSGPKGQTVVWDGQNPAVSSPGYSLSRPSASKVPNNVYALAYIDGRIWAARYGRQVVAGDRLHSAHQIDAIDVLGFTDQVYDATGKFFASPAEHGDVRAIGRMTLNGDTKLILVHSDAGILGIRAGIPRNKWVDTADMAFVVSDETAATGPWAYSPRDSRTIFRSARGIESIRSIADSGGTIYFDFSRHIRPLVAGDNPDLLPWASVVNPPSFERMFVTVQPGLSSDSVSHRALLSCSWNPAERPIAEDMSWEGTIVLPPALGQVVKAFETRIGGEERVFALTACPGGGRKMLVEASKIGGHDTAPDGAHIPISWAIKTRQLSLSDGFSPSAFRHGVLRLSGVEGRVTYRVSVRTSEQDWTQMATGEVAMTDIFRSGGETAVPVGLIGGRKEGARWIEILIEGTGVTSIDFALTAGEPGSIEEQQRAGRLNSASNPPSPFTWF